MDDLAARAKVAGDRACAALRSELDNLIRIGEKDPATWDQDEIKLAHRAVAGVIGLLLEGRI